MTLTQLTAAFKFGPIKDEFTTNIYSDIAYGYNSSSALDLFDHNIRQDWLDLALM